MPSEDPVVEARERLEEAIRDYFAECDGPGILLGAVVVVERRLENHTGVDGAATFHISMCEPVVESGHARLLGLLHWGREWAMHGPGDRSDGV
jgi:hypothetical protein